MLKHEFFTQYRQPMGAAIMGAKNTFNKKCISKPLWC
jgi:hypothetical protein